MKIYEKIRFFWKILKKMRLIGNLFIPRMKTCNIDRAKVISPNIAKYIPLYTISIWLTLSGLVADLVKLGILPI